ncbi:hypothetical protein CKM354_000142400 [Cercospora kikuchii]|uniref:DUF7605 domain-containing protein n=1 Tax=Cercospora kikuchii TaxID=84275 RepID=A0A9P3FBW6_9PEZI|nr:uncharacterized protein CKM354_000142400 [Cercospora kikuchii]GIZ37997.1 hypothetical protein CKM354_000142400 [Cercospora kikuchii]
MAPFEDRLTLKRKRSTDTAKHSTAGTGLFVTGQTPTPAPERLSVATPSTGRADSPIEVSDSDDVGVVEEERDDEDPDDNEDKDEEEYEEADEEAGEYKLDEVYSQEREPFPDVAAYSPRTAEAVDGVQNLMERFAQLLQPYAYSYEDVATMLAKAIEAKVKPMTNKQVIMLLGHTGSGKSSTTNSFVDDLGASKAAATGESCTCVPTLITATLSNQEKNYAAEIRIFGEEARRAFLLEHVKHYIMYEFEKDETWSDEQQHDYRLRHETALKILRALFCDKFEFESPGSIRSHFSAHQADPQQLVGDLEGWCQELLQKTDLSGTQPALRFDADTAKELNDALEPHTFESGTFDEPALWPLIEHVRKGIHGSRILMYTDFLDLPGTFDTNRVRAEFAHKYIRDSDALWTVTSIERPLSDAQLDRVLSTYADRFGSNAAVIATRSDSNIDDALAKAMQEKKQSVGEYWAQSAQIKALSKKLSAVEKKINANKGHKRQCTMSATKTAALYTRANELSTQLQETMNSQMDGLVDVRNSHIITRLKQDKKKHLALGAELSVFCISNTHYRTHKGIPSGDARLMSVESTGIPALRKHALRMASVREFNSTEEYVNKTLTLLKGALLWADAAPTQQNVDVMGIAQQPIALLNTFMEEFMETSADKCDISLIQPMIKNRSKYESAAVTYKNAIEEEWHPSTVRAFFIQEGNHSTNKKTDVWNERFISKQVDTAEVAWRAILLQLIDTLRGGVGKVIKAVEDIPVQLSSSTAGTPVAMQPLRGFVATCCNRIRTAFDTRMDDFDKKMKNVKMDTSRDVPSGYFTKAMRDMYEMCKGFRGKGCTQRMLDTLEDWLYGEPPQYGAFNSPFAAVTTSLQTELSEAITAVAKELHRDIEIILNDMAQHLERSVQGMGASTGEATARAAIGGALQKLKPEIEAIEKKLAAVKEQYGVPRE